MTLSEIKNPHDRIFQALMAEPVGADDFIRRTLPQDVADMLSTKLMERQDTSFLDSELKTSRCDALFKAWLLSGDPIHILVEHKSYMDRSTPLQVFRYKTRIQERHMQELADAGKPLEIPLVIPLVVYHGAETWTVPHMIPSSVPTEGALECFRPSTDYLYYDLKGWEAGGTKPNYADAVSMSLRSSSTKKMSVAMLDQILSMLPEGSILEEQVPLYIGAVYPTITRSIMMDALVRVRQTTGERIMQTIAEEYRQEGRQEGRAEGWKLGEAKGLVKGKAEGKIEGKADTLLAQMERRFGELPPDVLVQVQAASLETLEEWLGAILDADSVDEVLNGNGASR